MRSLVSVVCFMGLFALSSAAQAKAATEETLVVTLKDGRQQSFPVSDIARIEFKKTAAVRAASTPGSNEGRFLGKWKVGDGQGNIFTITLDRNGRARKSIGSAQGTWEMVGDEAHISWNDGWHDAIRKVGNRYQKFAYSPGKTFTDEPANVTDAKSTEPI